MKVAGFKDYIRAGLDPAAAQIMRIDIPLQLGALGESVTVTDEASLLKTESGDGSNKYLHDVLGKKDPISNRRA